MSWWRCWRRRRTSCSWCGRVTVPGQVAAAVTTSRRPTRFPRTHWPRSWRTRSGRNSLDRLLGSAGEDRMLRVALVYRMMRAAFNDRVPHAALIDRVASWKKVEWWEAMGDRPIKENRKGFSGCSDLPLALILSVYTDFLHLKIGKIQIFFLKIC